MGMVVDNQDLIRVLTRHDERLKNIYSTLNRIEGHLGRLNGKVDRHEVNIAKIQTWGGVALVTFPIMINIIMRFI
tara:strand:- start:690 stop:914 length:225 start_codon:yes stop_codon:yes gene_type:complete